MPKVYQKREGVIVPVPWCEEFSFHIKDIFTRLRMVEKEKTRGIVTSKAVTSMTSIFRPHDGCEQPVIVLIEGDPGMGKTTYCQNWYMIGQANNPVNGTSRFLELMCSCSSDVVKSNLVTFGTLLKIKFCQKELNQRQEKCFFNS